MRLDRSPIHGFRQTTTKFSSPTLRFLLCFLLFYTVLALYVRARSARDPGSVFFQPSSYELSYSAARLEEADAFIDQVDQNPDIEIPKASSNPQLCVGLATIAREGRRYFRSAVGTVLEGLSETERAEIYLITFIAHTNPSEHPAYNETWLHKVSDRVLLYNSTVVDMDVDIEHIHSLESEEAKKDAKEKALFDYRFLLKACEEVGAPYVVMMEDDIVAQDGWYHRTRAAIQSAEEQTKEIEASKWLYLRLFYTEKFLGWNADDWPVFLSYSVLTVAFVACSLTGCRQYNKRLRTMIPKEMILIACGICTPLLIGLFFAAGQVTTRPIPQGVHQMPRYACCSQAFVFPRTRVPDIVGWYTEKGRGEADSLTEEFADKYNEIRWAVTPSIVQHVGRTSSKTSRTGSVAKLWNFEFETNDLEVLREEHDRIKDQEYA
ncbi:uncharacterized protein PFLUO_LOCUS6125 [Penicillium psychrofluorescens]|uniref:uncharacterized protein n=1 Tax=Penicillium psychrofluorescens TaxID=3158075 RepID=UPI003CCC97E5